MLQTKTEISSKNGFEEEKSQTDQTRKVTHIHIDKKKDVECEMVLIAIAANSNDSDSFETHTNWKHDSMKIL